MSRKLNAATLALTIAGGVYLVASPVQASNMGFKLEREFPVIRAVDNDNRTNWGNTYLLSYPLFNGLGDVGNGLPTAPANKCVGDTGGPPAGDGVIDLTDGLCELWTSRNIRGSFALYQFQRDTCVMKARTAAFDPFGGVTFGGDNPVPTMTGPGERDAGYMITVSTSLSAPPLPQNRAVVVGSHDPSFTGRQIRQPVPDCIPRNDYISVSYHTMYRKAYELICGLEGIDWVDTTPADGLPDTCSQGIFDGTRAIQVLTYDNVKDSSVLTTDNAWTFASAVLVTFPPPARVTFGGSNFDLIPGDAYKVGISPGHTTTTFLSPHF